MIDVESFKGWMIRTVIYVVSKFRDKFGFRLEGIAFLVIRFLFFLVSLGIECLGSCGESIWNFGLVFFSRYEVKKCYRMEKLNRESCRIICSMAVN